MSPPVNLEQFKLVRAHSDKREKWLFFVCGVRTRGAFQPTNWTKYSFLFILNAAKNLRLTRRGSSLSVRSGHWPLHQITLLHICAYSSQTYI